MGDTCIVCGNRIEEKSLFHPRVCIECVNTPPLNLYHFADNLM